MRILAFDIIRIFACLCVLTIHFNASMSGYDYSGKFMLPNEIITNFPFGVYLGNIGVGLFFIISGCGLQLNNSFENLTCDSIRRFYYKRAKSLYPMFWIAFVVCHLAFIKNFPNAPLWNVVISLLGIDGYAMALGFDGWHFYKVGEWFLGCIICLYLIWPFLSYCFNRNVMLTTLSCLVLYVFTVELVNQLWFFLQIPYMLLGMIYVKYFKAPNNLWVTLSVILLMWVRFFIDNLPTLTISIITCWILFILITNVCELLQIKNYKCVGKIEWLSVLTYPLFLVHHVIISTICSKLNLQYISYREIVAWYVVYLLLSVICAVGLKFVCDILCKRESIMIRFNIIKANAKTILKQSWLGLVHIIALAGFVVALCPLKHPSLTNTVAVIFLLCFSVLICATVKVSCFDKSNTIFYRGTTSINVCYGDLLKLAFNNNLNEKRIVVIPVNTCFDTIVDEAGVHRPLVSAKTLHGQWINKMIGYLNNVDTLKDVIEESLSKSVPVKEYTLTEKERGNRIVYERGTVASIKYNDNTTFFLLALSEFDENNNAQCNKDEFIACIQKLINYINQTGQGVDVYVPIMGTNLSRTGMSHQESLQALVALFKLYQERLNCNVNIVIYEGDKSKVSIYDAR